MREPLAVLAILLVIGAGACGGSGPIASTPDPGPTGLPLQTQDDAPVATFAELPTLDPDPEILSAGYEWPMNVEVTIAGTSDLRSQAWSSGGPSRSCGNTAYGISTLSPTALLWEFPSDGQFQVNDLNFATDDLPVGGTTTAFSITVKVTTLAGDNFAGVSVDATNPNSTVAGTGTASLTIEAGVRILDVEATNRLGESIKLHGTCGPEPSGS